MNEDKEIELHQDEVKEIMEKPPHWLIGYGISLIGIILLILIVGSHFFKYPDMIKSPIILRMESNDSVHQKNITGKIPILQTQLAKVNVGQYVNIKLDCYPYQEYGVIRSRLKKIVCTENQDEGCWNYEAIVIIDTPIISSQNKLFHFWPEMSGEAEIITGDKRLLQQLLRPISAKK